MKRFWDDLVTMLAVSAYAEIEGVDIHPTTESKKPIFSTDAEQLYLQQI